jgi:hypothetical protein
MNLKTKFRALTFVLIAVVFANGCGTHNAATLGSQPDENSATLYTSPMQEYTGVGGALVIVTHLDGKPIKGSFLFDLPSTIIVKPGWRSVSLRYDYNAGWFAQKQKSWVLKFDAKRGHYYRGYARSKGNDYWAWIEDEATGDVIAGNKPPSS